MDLFYKFYRCIQDNLKTDSVNEFERFLNIFKCEISNTLTVILAPFYYCLQIGFNLGNIIDSNLRIRRVRM